MMKTFKIYFLSNLKINDTALLAPCCSPELADAAKKKKVWYMCIMEYYSALKRMK